MSSNFQSIIASTSLFAPFILIDPTLVVITSVILVSGVLIYAYHKPLTESLTSLEIKVKASSNLDRYRKMKTEKDQILAEREAYTIVYEHWSDRYNGLRQDIIAHRETHIDLSFPKLSEHCKILKSDHS